MTGTAQLPDGWEWTTLGQACQINPGKDKVRLKDEDPCTFVPMAAVSEVSGAIVAPERRLYRELKSGYTQFREGDVLFAKITPCMENGKVAIARNLENGVGFGSTEFFVLRASTQLLPEYIYLFVRAAEFRIKAKRSMKGAVGQQRVPKEFLEGFPFPLPPLDEQKRIVARLDSMLSKIKEARELIQEARDSFADRRAAILAKAFRGELTAKWREENPDVEPAEKLLERIREERHQRYEEQVGQAAAAGKKAPKRRPNLTRRSIDVASLPTLPSGWEWVTWDDLADWITYGFTRNLPHVPQGIPIVTAKNVRDGYLDYTDIEYTTSEVFAQLSEKDKPRRGEILITKDGAIRGRAAIVETDQPFCISQAVAVVRFGGASASAHFLLRFIQSSFVQDMIERESSGTAIPHISITDFGKFPVPLPPLREQLEIVRILDSIFAIQEEVSSCTGLDEDLSTLEKSILARAFRGELGTHDPD